MQKWLFSSLALDFLRIYGKHFSRLVKGSKIPARHSPLKRHKSNFFHILASAIITIVNFFIINNIVKKRIFSSRISLHCNIPFPRDWVALSKTALVTGRNCPRVSGKSWTQTTYPAQHAPAPAAAYVIVVMTLDLVLSLRLVISSIQSQMHNSCN